MSSHPLDKGHRDIPLRAILPRFPVEASLRQAGNHMGQTGSTTRFYDQVSKDSEKSRSTAAETDRRFESGKSDANKPATDGSLSSKRRKHACSDWPLIVLMAELSANRGELVWQASLGYVAVRTCSALSGATSRSPATLPHELAAVCAQLCHQNNHGQSEQACFRLLEGDFHRWQVCWRRFSPIQTFDRSRLPSIAISSLSFDTLVVTTSWVDPVWPMWFPGLSKGGFHRNRGSMARKGMSRWAFVERMRRHWSI